ncbi:hypothetical protein [Caulobacter soli]|uniref:hypothetical protein n=1 Tax=Caulobacter soli TaxID=2708539 RepID=UPI0013ECDEB3|nr:hypothetical protein [Caulobacter soli]
MTQDECHELASALLIGEMVAVLDKAGLELIERELLSLATRARHEDGLLVVAWAITILRTERDLGGRGGYFLH